MVESVSRCPSHPLIRLTEADGVEISLPYATDKNFVNKKVYTHEVAMLRPEAYRALGTMVKKAAARQLKPRIYDVFRPLEAQQKLWDQLPDPRYVSDPKEGGLHPRGVAVDLTLLDASTGQELDMGTPFDDMREQSWHGASDIPLQAIENRKLLRGLMEESGFEALESEWWHYHLPNPKNFKPLSAVDVPDGPVQIASADDP
jgi:D-alanyl-D-alanine dipeptidase